MEKIQSILDQVKEYSLNEMVELIGQMRDLYSDKYNATYHVVEVFNQQGNISDRIEKETGFECYHRQADMSGCIGTNVIKVPVEKYTDELKKELVEKYNNV